MANVCPRHHEPLELVPADPVSRCPSCHYMTHHLQFSQCPQCGHRMEITQLEPELRCPACSAEKPVRQRVAV